MLALCHVPKTAGTTMVGILRRSYGLRHCDVEPIVGRSGVYGAADHRFARRLHPRLASVAGHQVTPASDLDTVCPDLLYYAVLREPFARLVSQYQHIDRQSDPAPMIEVLERPWWRDRQCRQIAGVADPDAAVEMIERKNVLVGLTDAFDEFLVMLRIRSGDPRLDIRYHRRNVAPSTTVAERLQSDAEVRRAAEAANPGDWALWRRVRDEVYPAQRARFPELERELARFREEPPLPARSGRELANRVHRNLVYKPVLRTARALGFGR